MDQDITNSTGIRPKLSDITSRYYDYNPSIEDSPEVWSSISENLFRLPSLHGSPKMDTMEQEDILFKKFFPKTQETNTGLERLAKLTFDDLQKFSGHNVDNDSTAGDFLFSLRDAYILMIKRIVERYPDQYHYGEPQCYPEYEIYESVQGILEDHELANLGLEFGGKDFAEDEIDHVAFTVYNELDELFCGLSDWSGEPQEKLDGPPDLY